MSPKSISLYRSLPKASKDFSLTDEDLEIELNLEIEPNMGSEFFLTKLFPVGGLAHELYFHVPMPPATFQS